MRIFLSAFLFTAFTTNAQIAYHFPAVKNSLFEAAPVEANASSQPHRKLYQRNTGMVIGLQRGRYTFLELGGEAHFRKMSLLSPHIIGATANIAYNLSNNILAYHGGVWMKRGRINLTYGADINYYTDFNNRKSFGIGPSVGFRLFGLHLINGYNLLTNQSVTKTAEAPLPVNKLYMSLRYYFPVKNQFTWDRQTMRKKHKRKRERIKRQRQRTKQSNTKKTRHDSWNIFRSKK